MNRSLKEFLKYRAERGIMRNRYDFYSWTETKLGVKYRFWSVHRTYSKEKAHAFIEHQLATIGDRDVKVHIQNPLGCQVEDYFAERYSKKIEKYGGVIVHGKIYTDHVGTRTFHEFSKDRRQYQEQEG